MQVQHLLRRRSRSRIALTIGKNLNNGRLRSRLKIHAVQSKREAALLSGTSGMCYEKLKAVAHLCPFSLSNERLAGETTMVLPISQVQPADIGRVRRVQSFTKSVLPVSSNDDHDMMATHITPTNTKDLDPFRLLHKTLALSTEP